MESESRVPLRLDLFCLPRSGSNYLKALIESNSDIPVRQNHLFWKHTEKIVIEKYPTILLFPYKDCNEWLNSMFRYMKIGGDPYTPWFKTPFNNIHDWVKAPIGPKDFKWSNPIKMYEHYLVSALRLQSVTPLVAIPYRDILFNPQETLLTYLNLNLTNPLSRIIKEVRPSDDIPILGKNNFSPKPLVNLLTPSFIELKSKLNDQSRLPIHNLQDIEPT